jgi:hypothetical protein
MDNMKNIKELGLELIELEDELLLVDDNDVSNSPWVLWKDKVYSNKLHSFTGVKYDECKRVVTSTKSYEGLLLLVIKDENDIVIDSLEKILAWESYKDHPIYKHADYALGEYLEYKETYRFSEEDLRKAIQIARDSLHWHEECGWYTTKNEEEIIKSLTKKELWVEVEGYCGSPYTTDRCPKCVDCCDRAYQRLKITNNKIYSVWK